MKAEPTAIQDQYPDQLAVCFGCGRLNAHGHQLKSFPDGDRVVARFRPQPYHEAIPGFVYGGLLASLIDCHGTGTAAWAATQADPSGGPARFVTGRLEVSYRKPTPLGPELELVATVRERGERKIVVDVTLAAEGVVTVEGTVVAVRMRD